MNVQNQTTNTTMKSKITIEGLRKSGFKVAVMHRTCLDRRITHIIVTDTNGDSAEGLSMCNAEDNYNRKLGNKIALGRALKNLNDQIYCNFVKP
jgi:hypothetical protein